MPLECAAVIGSMSFLLADGTDPLNLMWGLGTFEFWKGLDEGIQWRNIIEK